ncbi:MarR family transcriptional regulator [Candidatus Daviesbacteria bacterium]|nr:MarR family transcriptional regulator [Candidatus Daviesbacteria bacterium]
MKHTLLFHTVNLGKKFQKCIDFDLSPVPLSYSQSSALILINAKKGISQKQIAQTLNLEPATVVTVIDDLEKLDLVTRENVNGDRRKYQIVLTRKGGSVIRTIKAHIASLEEFLKQRLSDKETKFFYLTLDKLDQSLEQWKGGDK